MIFANPRYPTFISFILTLVFCFCCFYLISLVYFKAYFKKPLQYSDTKEQSIEVFFVEDKIDGKQETKEEKKQIKEEKEKQTLVSVKNQEVQKENTHKNIKELFKSINVPTPESIKNVTQSNEKPKKIKKQTNKAQEIVKSLKLQENKSIGNKETNIGQKSLNKGKYNAYIGTITKILQTQWQQTNETEYGVRSIVKVYIDNLGNFSYSIQSYSYDEFFNQKLKNFLEEKTKDRFPPNLENITFEIIFGDGK